MALHASIAIGGIDVTPGKPDENGATDAIVANGENAGVFMTSANGVDDMSIVTTGGNTWILSRI
ncbi:hypothetical protein AGR1B_pa0047 [Agrobacterium fabacearum S56]|nr:hypothetical protein AGR1B_pa0047 [Agrobacterium fabacearum S56]